MKNIYIRKFSIKDVDEVYGMLTKWSGEKITYGLVAGKKKDLAKRTRYYFFVAEMNGIITGFVYGSVRTSKGLAVMPTGEKYLEVEEIYVKPGFRNKNIGSELLKYIIQNARSKGIKKFFIYSATKDLDRILKFYRRHGFKSWCVQMYR